MRDSAHRKLAIIAGAGELPLSVMSACDGAARSYCVLAIEGEADAAVLAKADVALGYGSIGRAISVMREQGCGDVVLCGRVGRPDFGSLKLDWKGIKVLPRVVGAARKGDDALLTELGRIFEEEGFRLIAPDDVAGELLAPEGVLTVGGPDGSALSDITHGIAVARALGVFDVGQGAVVCDGLVLAVEAAEGTDAMLARCAVLPQRLRGTADARRGVLVKVPKPNQERRIDLPVIGVPTVEGVAKAGLAGIAVEAGGALILSREALLDAANRAGVFVYGFKPGSA